MAYWGIASLHLHGKYFPGDLRPVRFEGADNVGIRALPRHVDAIGDVESSDLARLLNRADEFARQTRESQGVIDV